MRVWDAMCGTIHSSAARRGAMMATLRCDHPDIGEFIDAKRVPDALRFFNLSVLVTDAFLDAVDRDAPWPLVFPAETGVRRVDRVATARQLWNRLCESAYRCAEPGVLFVDRINAANNLGYCESLTATNPCGEEPLPPYGACNLGSVNLPAFVVDPFGPRASLDQQAIASVATVAVRFLDNIIDLSRFPLIKQQQQVRRSRRIGLGITGLADALAMLSLRYDSEAARQVAARAMQTIRDAAYRASVEIAAERGAFPALEASAYLNRPFTRALPEDIRNAIRHTGIRNSHLLAIAPAGTISLLAGNVSSGIEPIFQLQGSRRLLGAGGTTRDFATTDYAYSLWLSGHDARATPPRTLVTGPEITAQDQLLMQAALQPCVDGAISKTVVLTDDFPESGVSELFRSAHQLGLKGCTIYRAQARPGIIGNTNLGAEDRLAHASRCCEIS
jgi:ribonucleoside-diphosphate reductase alpha chain